MGQAAYNQARKQHRVIIQQELPVQMQIDAEPQGFQDQNQLEIKVQQGQQQNRGQYEIGNFLRDQPFYVQKNQTIKALILLFVMEILKLLMMLQIQNHMGKQIEFFGFNAFPFFVLTWFICVFINSKYKYQNRFQASWICFSLALAQSIAFASFPNYFESEKKEGEELDLEFTNQDMIYSISLNSVYISIIICYVYVETKRIRAQIIYTILSLITFVLFCLFKLELLVSSLLSLFYGVSLLHSIKQIWNGRFSIFIGEIIQMTNGLSIGIYLPCYF